MRALEIHSQALLTAPETDDEITTRILEAALEEFTAYGLRRVTIDDIARRAGLHRTTVYRRFSGKDSITQAVLIRSARRLFTRVAESVSALPTVEDRLVEGFARSVRIFRRDSLLARLLISEPEVALPLLTLGAGPLLATARLFLADQVRYLQAEGQATAVDADATAEIVLRLAWSVILMPDGYFSLDSDDDLREFARRHFTLYTGRRPG